MEQTAASTRPTAQGGFEESVVAVYRNHADAEKAVLRLRDGGIPVEKISIIGRDWRLREDIQGFYTPAQVAVEGAAEGAWMGGLFGLLLGFGLFLIPGAGPLVALGPLAGFIAGMAGGAGIGALVSALMAAGVPEEEALRLQARLEAGEFLVVVNGTAEEVARAREILQGTDQTALQTYQRPASQPGGQAVPAAA